MGDPFTMAGLASLGSSIMESIGIGGAGAAGLGGSVIPSATAAVGGTSALGGLSALGTGATGLGGAVMPSASVLGSPSIASKVLGGVIRGGFPGTASSLASKGLGQLGQMGVPGMTGASNFLAENPIPIKMGIGQQATPTQSPVIPPRSTAQPSTLGQSPISAPQKTAVEGISELVDKKLNDFVKQFMQSQR
jgi:hypothetical protein